MSDDEDGRVEQLRNLGPETLKYLAERSSDSFKRQTDLEESIWRTLPLFTGALIAAGAIIANAGKSLPPFGDYAYALLSYGLLALSTGAFSASFWWLWQVVRPREFDYPPEDRVIQDYALGMGGYYAGGNDSEDEADNAVLAELRAYMTHALGEAAGSAFVHNQRRLSARSQVLVFLLAGFLLAFACDATIFGHKLLLEAESHGAIGNGAAAQGTAVTLSGHSAEGVCRAPTAAADASDPGRGLADKGQHGAPGAGQVDAGHEADALTRSSAHRQAIGASAPIFKEVTRADRPSDAQGRIAHKKEVAPGGGGRDDADNEDGRADTNGTRQGKARTFGACSQGRR